jgi:hypothetical protein
MGVPRGPGARHGRWRSWAGPLAAVTKALTAKPAGHWQQPEALSLTGSLRLRLRIAESTIGKCTVTIASRICHYQQPEVSCGLHCNIMTLLKFRVKFAIAPEVTV